jgi:hypothetical protein
LTLWDPTNPVPPVTRTFIDTLLASALRRAVSSLRSSPPAVQAAKAAAGAQSPDSARSRRGQERAAPVDSRPAMTLTGPTSEIPQPLPTLARNRNGAVESFRAVSFSPAMRSSPPTPTRRLLGTTCGGRHEAGLAVRSRSAGGVRELSLPEVCGHCPARSRLALPSSRIR